MEYYYDKDNDFYVIKINGKLNQAEYEKLLRDIIYNEKRPDIHVYYSTVTKDFKYIIVDFNKRILTDDEIMELLNNKKRVR